jgi:hypothetical protein
MKRLRQTILAVTLAVLLPSSSMAQSTGSAGCTAITQSAANAAVTRIQNGDTNIKQPNSVKNMTCLTNFFSGTGLNVVNSLLNPTALFDSIVTQICKALAPEWKKILGATNCGITLTSFKLGFLGGLGGLGGGFTCPKLAFGGGGPPIGTLGIGTGNNTRNYVAGQTVTPSSYPLSTMLGMF